MARQIPPAPRPVELGGRGHGNNPEQLFAAGYSACFLSAMKNIAASVEVDLPAETSVIATIGIGPRAQEGFGLSVALHVECPVLNAPMASA